MLPKSVTPSRIKSNLEGIKFSGLQVTKYFVCLGRVCFVIADAQYLPAVFELPLDAFERVASLDRNDRYNLMARLGVDIFGDAKPGVLEKAEADFKAANKKARGL